MTAEYVVVSGVVIVDKFTATNISAGAVALTVHIVPPAGSVGDDNLVVQQLLVAVGENRSVIGLMGHTLQTGATIYCQATASNALVLFASGRAVA
jgi:hypothetical protein